MFFNGDFGGKFLNVALFSTWGDKSNGCIDGRQVTSFLTKAESKISELVWAKSRLFRAHHRQRKYKTNIIIIVCLLKHALSLLISSMKKKGYSFSKGVLKMMRER